MDEVRLGFWSGELEFLEWKSYKTQMTYKVLFCSYIHMPREIITKS
jgi:hypothetical protein